MSSIRLDRVAPRIVQPSLLSPPSLPAPTASPLQLQRVALSPRTAAFLQKSTAVPSPNGKDISPQKKVDLYLSKAHVEYKIDGKSVKVAPQFRMAGGYNQENVQKGLKALSGHMGNQPGQIPLGVVGRVFAGRGSPEEVGQVTKKLIDLGKLPPASAFSSPQERVQAMMWKYGVGIDCAGYVQRAITSLHGKTSAQLGLRDSINEDLSGLGRNAAFRKVDIFDAKPGDVITLRDNHPGQPGHTVIVARHDKSTGVAMASKFDSKDPAAQEFLHSKDLEVFEVDSSWGAGEHGVDGGLKRVLWVHNRETGNWASFNKAKLGMILDTSPYLGHTISGTYRVKLR